MTVDGGTATTPVGGDSTPGAGQEFSTAEARNSIRKTLTDVFNQLANVTVITAVGNPMVTLSTSNRKIQAQVTSDPSVWKSVFTTQFNLVEGDIIATVPENLDQLEKVAELHTANVDKAVRVLPANIQAMANTALEIFDLMEDDPAKRRRR